MRLIHRIHKGMTHDAQRLNVIPSGGATDQRNLAPQGQNANSHSGEEIPPVAGARSGMTI
jgi:hypothetical protein